MRICVYIYIYIYGWETPTTDLLRHTLPVSIGYTLSLLISLWCCILCVLQVPPLPIRWHLDEKKSVGPLRCELCDISNNLTPSVLNVGASLIAFFFTLSDAQIRLLFIKSAESEKKMGKFLSTSILCSPRFVTLNLLVLALIDVHLYH